MANSDPLKSVENIVQLPSLRRVNPVPTLQLPRAQPTPLVMFASWVAARDRAAAALLGGTTRLLLTGPAGTGKTVLVEHVARVLRAAGRTVIIQLADADPAPPGLGATLIVDEADRLSALKLQQLFSDAAGTVVLTGLDPLVRRVPAGTLKLTIDPLGRTEAQAYIAQWLALHGRTPAELDSKAVRALVDLSGGVPRLLSTLLAAGSWLAKSSDARIIEAVHIQEAAELRSVLGPTLPPNAVHVVATPTRPGRVVWSALLAGLVLAGIAAAIVPRLFPAEVEQAVQRATPFVQMAERWLRDEPAAAPASSIQPAFHAVVPPPLEVDPLPVVSAPPAELTAASELSQAAPEPPQSVPLPELKQPEAPPAEATPPPVPQPAPVASVSVASSPPLPASTIELLLRRGREMLALDDLSAARLLFTRAAEGGSPEAMFQLGQTYDTAVRGDTGALGQSDRAEALRWYRRAADAGYRSSQKLMPSP